MPLCGGRRCSASLSDHAPPILDLSGDWPPYVIRQAGRAITLDSEGVWTANGWIQDDGSILLFWRNVNTLGNYGQAVGVYRVKDGNELRGPWAFLWDMPTVEGDAITGYVRGTDVIKRRPSD